MNNAKTCDKPYMKVNVTYAEVSQEEQEAYKRKLRDWIELILFKYAESVKV